MLLLFTLGLRAQSDSSTYDLGHLYTRAEILSDFQLLKTALEKGHPGLYSYSSHQSIDAEFQRIEQGIDGPMAQMEFYRLVVPLITKIQCGHTWARLSSDYYRNENFFPLGLNFIDNRGYVARNFSHDSTIVEATEIIEINGLSMAEILDQIAPTIATDGNNESSKKHMLNTAFTFYYGETFDQADTFSMKAVLYKSKDTVDLVLPAVPKKRIDAIAYKQFSSKNVPLRAEINPKEGTAVLTIQSFSGYHFTLAKQRYRKFLKKNFRKIRRKKVDHLVIDLRKNGGGDDQNSNLLFSYIYANDFNCFSEITLAGNEQDSFLSFTDWDTYKCDLTEKTGLNAQGKHILTEHSGLERQFAQRKPYQGKVLVLMDGSSLSATGMFAALAHHYKRAEFAGEPAGTSYYRINGYLMPMLTLPNTKIRVRIPLMQGKMALSGFPDDGTGVQPNYLIVPTLDDLVHQKDSVLSFALQWATSKAL